MLCKKVNRILSIFLCLLLIFQQSGLAQSALELNLGSYFTRLHSQITPEKFRPLHLRSLAYDNQSNNFKLLLDKGDFKINEITSKRVNETTQELLKYFFIGISLPNEAFWVNLRPDAEDNTIDPELAKTDIGKILLEADVQLKKDTAAYTSPQSREGKQYWNKLYKKAEEFFGDENITIPTLTRPWIVPNEVILRETSTNAYIYKATLKVMLEADYLVTCHSEAQGAEESKNGILRPFGAQNDAGRYNFKDPRLKALNDYSTQLIKELIIPKLTLEINTSKKYSNLRQVYYSLILAQWFKSKFYGKGGTYAWLINKKNLQGLTSKTNWSKTTYFKEYQKSFKDGEYSIKEPVQTLQGQSIRSYFSGGIVPMPSANQISSITNAVDGLPKTSFVIGAEGVSNSDNPFEITVITESTAQDSGYSGLSQANEIFKKLRKAPKQILKPAIKQKIDEFLNKFVKEKMLDPKVRSKLNVWIISDEDWIIAGLTKEEPAVCDGYDIFIRESVLESAKLEEILLHEVVARLLGIRQQIAKNDGGVHHIIAKESEILQLESKRLDIEEQIKMLTKSGGGQERIAELRETILGLKARVKALREEIEELERQAQQDRESSKTIPLEDRGYKGEKPSGSLAGKDRPSSDKTNSSWPFQRYFDFQREYSPAFIVSDRWFYKDVMFWPTTNENDWDASLGLMKDRKGVYLGTGCGGQNFSRLCHGNFEQAIIIDNNPYVTEIYMPIRAALISLSRTRAEYIGFLTGVEFSDEKLLKLEGASLEQIDTAIYDRIKNTTLNKQKANKINAWDKIAYQFPEGTRQLAREFWFDHSVTDFFIHPMIAAFEGKDGWLNSEANFTKIKKMTQEGKILGLTFDWTNKTDMGKIGEYLRKHKLAASVVYTSNIAEGCLLNDDGSKTIYRNIGALPLTGDAIFLESFFKGNNGDSHTSVTFFSQENGLENSRFFSIATSPAGGQGQTGSSPATAEKLEEIIFNAWKKIAQVGSLEEIRAMDRFEFAKRLGAKEIRSKDEFLGRSVYVSKKIWLQISEDRKKIAAGQRELPNKPEDKAVLLCKQIDGPGVYYNWTLIKKHDNEEGYNPINKSTFAHEVFEEAIVEAGLTNEHCVTALGHADILVLVNQLRFANLMGVKEFFTVVGQFHDERDRLYYNVMPEPRYAGEEIQKEAIRMYIVIDDIFGQVHRKGNHSYIESEAKALWNSASASPRMASGEKPAGSSPARRGKNVEAQDGDQMLPTVIFSDNLSPEQIEKLRYQGGFLEHDDNGRIKARFHEEGGKPLWLMFNTPLGDINSSIYQIFGSKSLYRRIVEMARTKLDETVYVLDWGAGNLRAVADLSEQLLADGIQNVRVIAFGDSYYPKTIDKRIGKNILFIVDVAENLAKDIKKYIPGKKIDIVYSFAGMHFLLKDDDNDDGKAFLKHIKALSDVISDRGFIMSHVALRNRINTCQSILEKIPKETSLSVQFKKVVDEAVILLAKPHFFASPSSVNADRGKNGADTSASSPSIPDQGYKRGSAGFGDSSLRSESTPQVNKTLGGVDFRAVPIVSSQLTLRLRSGQAVNSSQMIRMNNLNLNLDKEWLEIQKLINAGITPSNQRIKEYLQVCCQKGVLNNQMEKLLGCIAEIMRIQEGRIEPTDSQLKEMLVLLESGKAN